MTTVVMAGIARRRATMATADEVLKVRSYLLYVEEGMTGGLLFLNEERLNEERRTSSACLPNNE